MNSNSKKAVVRAISAILNSELLDKNKLTLITSYGIIMGKPVAADFEFDKAMDNPEYFAEKVGLNLLAAIYTKAAGNTAAKMSDEALLLSDVTVYPHAEQSVKFDQLIVFYDHIEAITIGDAISSM